MGVFFRKNEGKITYVGGLMNHWVGYDEDRLSFFELVSLWKDIGYTMPCKMIGLKPGMELDNGAVLLTDDVDVMYLLNQHKIVNSYRMDIYVVPSEESLGKVQVEVEPGVEEDEEGEEREIEWEVEEEVNGGIEGYGQPNDKWEKLLDRGLEQPYYEDIFSNFRHGELGDKPIDKGANHACLVNVNENENLENAEDVDLTEFNEDPLIRNDMTSPPISDGENDMEKWPQFNKEIDMENPRLEKGMEFKNAASFRNALREYCVQNCVDYRWHLNKGYKMSAICKNECGWRIYASKNRDSQNIQIKTFYPSCKCGRTFDNAHVTSTYLAKRSNEELIDNPKWAMSNV